METPTETRLELKYCEGCGALCLRPADQKKPYCDKCESRMAQISRKGRGTKGGRS
jgi:hypothetical protein